jgi:hypothetical protein
MSTLQINADLKYIEFLLHFICNSNDSKTIKNLKSEFKDKFQIDLPYLLNQNFGIIRLIPLLLIREDLKNSGKKYDKKITVIRHALAHNNFSITEHGYEFFSDRGNCQFSYSEFTEFIHNIENEFYQS